MNKFAVAVTDDSFESDVSQSVRPVLVYFWAEWCEECRYMARTLDAIAESKLASLQVGWLNVDENPRMAQQLAIRMVPTTILFIMGKEQRRIEGVTNPVHLSSTVEMYSSAKSDDEISEADSVN